MEKLKSLAVELWTNHRKDCLLVFAGFLFGFWLGY